MSFAEPDYLTTKSSGQKVAAADANKLSDADKQLYANDVAIVGGETIPASLTGLNTRVSTLEGASVRRVGELLLTEELITLSASNPFYNLSKADAVLSSSNFPNYITYLRALKLRYDPLNTNVHQIAITHYEILTNVASIWMTDSTAALKLGNALAEDELVHGSFTDWRTITTTSAIGDIPAGDYAITAMSYVSVDSTYKWKISFAYTHADVTRTANTTPVEFYPRRIAGSTTTARHFAVQGRGFITVGDSDSEWIGGLRRRDRGQGFQVGGTADTTGSRNYWGYLGSRDNQTNNQAGAGNATPYFYYAAYQGSAAMIKAVNDGTNGDPRTGKTTDIRGLGIHAYHYVGTYTP